MKTDKLTVETRGRKLTMARSFDAPRDLLFRMWSSCQHLKHWWGPKEWPMEECTMDFRVGGEWRYCLRGPSEEDESWGKATYREIVKPEKIVYDDHFTDSEGTVNDEMPELLVTVTFSEDNGQTRMVSTTLFDTPETLNTILEMGMVEGMNSSLDRLEEHLATV